MNPEDVFEQATEESNRARDIALDVVEYFIDNEGEVFGYQDAVDSVSERYDVSDTVADSVVTHLVSDDVDPVVHVSTKGTRYVTVAEFTHGDWWYGYKEFDDVRGSGKKVVCSQCVAEKDHPSQVGTVFELDLEYSFTGYDDMAEWLHENHFENNHPNIDVGDVDIEIGASLATGTTIASNTSVHGGNLSSFGVTGFDPGTVSDGEFLKNSGGSLAGGSVSEGQLPKITDISASGGTITWNPSESYSIVRIKSTTAIALDSNGGLGIQINDFTGDYAYAQFGGTSGSRSTVGYLTLPGDTTEASFNFRFSIIDNVGAVGLGAGGPTDAGFGGGSIHFIRPRDGTMASIDKIEISGIGATVGSTGDVEIRGV